MSLKEILEISLYRGDYLIPNKLTSFMRECLLGIRTTSAGWVTVDPWTHSLPDDCHNNVTKWVEWYGGERISGFYWIEDMLSGGLVAVAHSILLRNDGVIIDITPFGDERSHNLFSVSSMGPTENHVYGYEFMGDRK